jgi:glycosyl transferase family 25
LVSGNALGSSLVNRAVDAVYVVSVKTFTERIAHMQAELGRHGIAFEFMFDHDATDLDPEMVARTFEGDGLGRGAQSLVLKTIAIWRKALERGQARILILEDDALLDERFAERFCVAINAARALPPGWLLFLGGHDTKVPDRFFLAPGPLVELPIATAEGYVCDAEALRRRLAWLAEHRVSLALDHFMRQVDPGLGIRQFWLTRPIVQQGSVVGLFDSALDQHRLKHGRTYNILRNRWNKLQRHTLRGAWVRLKSLFGVLPP